MIRNLEALRFTWTDSLTLFKKVKVKDERGVTKYEDVEVKIKGKLLQTSMHNGAVIPKDGLAYEVNTKRKFICAPEEEVIPGLECFVRGDKYTTGSPFKYPTHLEIPLEG